MKKANNCSIDVIIPVFNCEKFILDAVRSVENQTCRPDSIIIVDDGSTDNTLKILQKYISLVPLEVITKKNEGPNSARNLGLKMSNSEMVAFLDADDVWSESKLEEQLSLFILSEFKNLGLVYTDYILIDENGNKINDQSLYKINPYMRGKIFDKLIKGHLTAGSSSVMIKRKCFDKVGYFDENLRFGEDWDMWLRLSKEYEFDYVNNPLVKVRNHSLNTQKDKDLIFANEIKFQNKWIPILRRDRIYFANRIIDQIINQIKLKKYEKVPEYCRIANCELKYNTKKYLFHYTLNSIFLYLIIRLCYQILKRISRIFL